ncbi:MAG TPA: hypothetical protein VGI21_13990, partial [Streptosporangiaceae bacterium]
SGVTAAWCWNSIPEPAFSQLPDDVRSWEQDRYQAYQAWLAGQAIADVFQRATGFLNLAAVRVAAEASALAAWRSSCSPARNLSGWPSDPGR